MLNSGAHHSGKTHRWEGFLGWLDGQIALLRYYLIVGEIQEHIVMYLFKDRPTCWQTVNIPTGDVYFMSTKLDLQERKKFIMEIIQERSNSREKW